jgi:phage tail-like protein
VQEIHEYQLKVHGPDTSEFVKIPLGVLTIGRQPGNDLVLQHPMVSRRHAHIECNPESCQIVDLSSANGTKVNGEKLVPNVAATIIPESVISIGPFTLILEMLSPKQEPDVEISSRVEDLEDAEGSPEKPAHRQKAVPLAEAEAPAMVPPSTPAPPPPPEKQESPSSLPRDDGLMPADIFTESTRLLKYLPGIYHSNFMSRFLGLFESIWMPIEWNVDNFDLFLDPRTAPSAFLPWLAQWFEITFDSTWDEGQRRTFLEEAYQIFEMRGTRWSLERVLQIYTGCEPQIMDCGEDQEPFMFTVHLPVSPNEVKNELIEAIIDACKPAHTTYNLAYKE